MWNETSGQCKRELDHFLTPDSTSGVSHLGPSTSAKGSSRGLSAPRKRGGGPFCLSQGHGANNTAWIEFHEELWEHWKVQRLASSLGCSYPTALGLLACLWTWTCKYARDGKLSKFSNEEICRAMRYETTTKTAEAIVQCLIETSWLDADKRIHEWSLYGTRLLDHMKRRVRTYRKVKRGKERKGKEGGYGNVTETLPNQRRETDFDKLWSIYPNKHGKQAAAIALRRLQPSKELFSTLVAAIAVQRQWPQWTKDGGQFIPHLSTWLNGKRWEDRPPEGIRKPREEHPEYDRPIPPRVVSTHTQGATT